MQGPTQRWDQPPDPRESTVSMPRIDPSWLADHVGEPAPAANDGLTAMELPGFGDPYAVPTRAAESGPAAGPVMELTVTPERAATPGPPAAGLPRHHVPPAPLEREQPVEPAEPPEQPASEEIAPPERLPGLVSRGATAEPARRAVRRADSATPGKPPPGSIAELRGRLDRLPDGHPSSPYDDAGWLRPSPTRLRQLELGLPARSLGAPTGYAERFGIDPDDDWLSDRVTAAAPASPRPQPSRPGEEPPPGSTAQPEPAADDAHAAGLRPGETGQVARRGTAQDPMARRQESPVRPTEPDEPPARGQLTDEPPARGKLPDVRPSAATRPDEPPSPATRPAASNGHHEPGDGDRPLGLEHPYAASAEPDHGGNGSLAGDLAVARWPADSTAVDRESERVNGHRSAAKLPEASLAERGSPDHDRQLRDNRRGDLGPRDDASAQARPRLAPQDRDLVERILAACRAAEGRNARGYGTSGLTPALRRIAAQLPAGGLAPGSEADTLKPAGRFATRLARLIDRQPGRPPAELAATISDAIRYAFSFPADDYTEGTLLVHRKLKAQGFDLEARRNQWDSGEYKGIFTRWRDPAHGLAFEVQFHTTESWAAVKQGHDAYLRITDPATPAAERARLRARQAAAAAKVSVPADCLDIADFRAGAR